MANIKVAVRVRPISARELNLTGSEVVVHTESNGISLTNVKVSSSKAGDSRERTRKYGFDYCFDSSNPEAQSFADQARIYQTLGQTVLDALFTGYNSCLVAYGQSASGKTYTVMGTKEDPGLTPRLCEGIFARIEEERKNERNYSVSVSYLEIYNEKVRDLLKSSSSTSGLRVREHPRLGPYVQGLTHHAVRTLGSLMSYVEEGTKARKTASTLQNPSSSRSHALLTIAVTEESQCVGNSVCSRKKEISPRGGSKLRLVDLAGSESAATCSGVHRLKEGANINKSLVALGNVISALAERGTTGSGSGRRFIPYRDSSLTWLLKDALGGNATTIMLATISPASGSYNETAHTLRFAQRAQSVVNRPVVNEDPVARIIRELSAEVARLKSLLLEKNAEAATNALCCCQKNRPNCNTNTDRSSKEAEAESTERSTLRNSGEKSQEEEAIVAGSRIEEEKRPKSVVSVRRSNSSDSVTTYEVGSSKKKFGSLEFLATSDRFNRAKVTELNDEEDEVSEIHESVFVDIPTLVAVLIKPDNNLQESSVQIEEICSDEVVEEESIDVDFEAANDDHETFGEFEKLDSIDHDDRSSSVNSCHTFGDIEAETYQNSESHQVKSVSKPKQKPKFRKQDSVHVFPTSVLSNLHTLKKFGSVETIQKNRDPVFSLERSHTNLEKRCTVPDRVKKLNNIREIDDQKISNRGNWSKEQLQRKGSNDSDKSLKESNNQPGSKIKNYARKPSLENLKRKTSKDSSSSSSKDEQILISSLARDKLLRRKNSLDQEPSIRNHTPIQRVKRAEIVAAVTERLYSSRKNAEDVPGMRSPPDTGEVKSVAKLKLQEISRKMLGKRRRVCVDTQTDCSRTIRMKDTASLTETPRIVCQDVAVLTDYHQDCEYVLGQKTPILRVKETATSTEKPKTNIVRCKDVGSLANDLEEYDYEIHSPRNDSGVLSDDTQNYAESNLSSTEVSDLCQEADRRVVYAESSTNTSMFSSCRSFAVQTPRPEVFGQSLPQNKAPTCARRCCNSIKDSRSHSSINNSEKSVISISLPDTINITIETMNTVDSRIAVPDNEVSQQNAKCSTKDEEAQTNEWNDLRNEIFCSKDQTTSTPSQTDSRVFRIENIFQDPNNAAKYSRTDPNRMQGTRIRNSITFRNSLGTSYVPQSKKHESSPREVHAEGFIRDGLITEAFINRKRSFNLERTPSSAVYQDPWRNWQVPVSLVNTIHPIDSSKGLGVIPSSWQPEVGEIPLVEQSLSHRNYVEESQVEFEVDNIEEISKMKSPSCNIKSNNNMDHEHGFSDDSLDYNESNVCSESMILKSEQMVEQRENFCPPDVVAHTKKDCSKSIEEKNDSINDFEDNQVEFPKKNLTESTEAINIHDYKFLILGRPCYNYEETNDESNIYLNHVKSSGKKKVSFSNSNVLEKKLTCEPSGTLKSIIKKRMKKNMSEVLNSSNDETDDSQQEERINLTLESERKGESASSEEDKEDQDSVKFEGNSKQNRKKVKFSVEESSENTCSESDSYENVEEEEEEDEDDDDNDNDETEKILLDRTGRNVLEEYLSEAVTFMRNLNSISEYVNGTSMLERNPLSWTSLDYGRGGQRGGRRRSCLSSWNRDYSEFVGRKVNPKNDDDYLREDDDTMMSMDSYERCMRGIQRLEHCIRRVDKHNELLRKKYGINCESAGARLDLASPSTEPRASKTNDDFEILRETESPLGRDSSVVEQKEEDDLEKKIFNQLMNVANSIRYRNSNKLQSRLLASSESNSRNPSCGSKFREKYRYAMKEPFCGDVKGNFSLEETSDDRKDLTTYEITGNLSVEKTCSAEQKNDDLDSIMEEDFLPLRRFNRSSWSTDLDRPTFRTDRQDDSSKYSFLSKYKVNDSRTSDTTDSLGKMYNMRGSFPKQRVLTDSARKRFQETDDYSRRTRDGCCRMCACSKDHSDIESTPGEIMHLRDKLKYPGSPRARFLELLRERRRIVECSRGTSAS